MSDPVYVYEQLENSDIPVRQEYDLSDFSHEHKLNDDKIGKYEVVVYNKFHFLGNLYKAGPDVSNVIKIGWENDTSSVKVTRKAPTDIYSQTRDAIVTLTIIHNREAWVGSGFFMKHNNHYFIYTVAHNVIVSDRDSRADVILASISNINGSGQHKVVTCNVVGVAGYADLAVLKVIDYDINNQKCLSWGDSKRTTNGQTCYVLGDPRGIDAISITKGVIRDNKYIYGSIVESICVSASIYGGNSGGPIVDATGKVIGVVSFGMENTDTLSWGCAQSIAEIVLQRIIDTNSNYIGGTLNAEIYPVDAIYCHFRNFVPSLLLGYFVYNTNNNKLNRHDIIQKINNKPIGLYHQQYTPSDIYLNPEKNLQIVLVNTQMKRVSNSIHITTIGINEDTPGGNSKVDIKKIGPIKKHYFIE